MRTMKIYARRYRPFETSLRLPLNLRPVGAWCMRLQCPQVERLLARLWPSGSVAERIGNAFLERWAELVRLAWMTRHDKTLFLPEMSPHSGECIAEGGAAFVIPGRAHNGPACLRAELCGKQGHEGE